MRLWQLATRQWGPPQKNITTKRECWVWHLVDKHTIPQICCLKSVEMQMICSRQACCKIGAFMSFSSTWQLLRSAATPLWHLGCSSAESNMLRYSYVLVWWRPAIWNMLQSVSKQNINAFVAIYAVMGRELAVKSQCRWARLWKFPCSALFVRKPSVTNSRFLAGERRRQSCAFMNMCIRSFRGSVIRTLFFKL